MAWQSRRRGDSIDLSRHHLLIAYGDYIIKLWFLECLERMSGAGTWNTNAAEWRMIITTTLTINDDSNNIIIPSAVTIII